MKFYFDISLNFSLLGFTVFGLLGWAVYKGYQKGAITMALSVFALGTGLIISSAIAHWTYIYFWRQAQAKEPEVFGAIILALFFSGAIWFAHIVENAVHIRVKDAVQKDKNYNALGAVFGFIKMFIITGVFSLIILTLDSAGHFLPKNERASVIVNSEAWVMSRSVRMLRMDYHKQQSPPKTSINQNTTTKKNTTTVTKPDITVKVKTTPNKTSSDGLKLEDVNNP